MSIIKRCVICFISMVLISIAPAIYVNAQTTTEQCSTFPVEVTDMKVNRRYFFKEKTFKYSMTIKDLGIQDYINENGGFSQIYYNEPLYYLDVDGVYLYWKSTRGQYVIQSYEWTEKSKEKGELKISGKIPVREGMRNGTWYLSTIYFQFGDEIVLVKDNRECTDEEDIEPMMDFSAVDFKVKMHGEVDEDAPTLDLKSMKLSKSYVKKKQKSTFSIKVKDDSKVNEVVCIWDVYDKTNKSDDGDYFDIYRMKYNKKTKKYECSVKLDTKYESKAQLVGIEVRDIYGNDKNYYSFKSLYDGKRDKKYYKAYKNMTVKAR